MPDQTTPSSSMSSLRAVAHPLRLQMLSLLTGAAMSAAELARELDITHANASYHLRVLATSGLVVEADEEKIRGGVAKRYRHPWDSPGTTSVGEDPQLYIRAVAEELVRRFRARRHDGHENLTADAEMWVPTEVWTEIIALVRQASALVHREARPPRTSGTVHVNLTAAAFEMVDPETRGPRTDDDMG